MAVKCFDLGEMIALPTNPLLRMESSPESVDSFESEEDDILTIPEARNLIKDRFATYHKLLNDKESELLAELEMLEETNKSKLDHVKSDLLRLRGAIGSLDEVLGTNTLKVFYEKQKSSWEEQIRELERSESLLSHVELNISDEIFVENLIHINPYLSKTKFRSQLTPLLESEPKLGEDWYIVSTEWFSEFTTSINLTDPQPNDKWEFPVKIPIQTSGNSVEVLHSKAWDMLLAFNGFSPGSIPIKRQSYLNETTNKIEVPIQTTKHKCTIGHNSRKTKFSIECEIEIFPYETYEDILNKLSGFSTLFTKHTPIIYSFDCTYTITCTLSNTQYTVNHRPLTYRCSYQEVVPIHIQNTESSVGTTVQLFLIIIPDSTGHTDLRVREGV